MSKTGRGPISTILLLVLSLTLLHELSNNKIAVDSNNATILFFNVVSSSYLFSQLYVIQFYTYHYRKNSTIANAKMSSLKNEKFNFFIVDFLQ